MIKFLLETRGEKGTLLAVKAYRLYLQQCVLEQARTPLSFRKVGKDGHPKILKPWIDLAFGTLDDKRALMSLWRCIEVFRVSPSYDTTSITSPSTAEKSTIDEIIAWLPTWDGLKALPKELPRSRILMSNKAGPNGPATATAFRDRTGLSLDPYLEDAVRQLLLLSKSQLVLDDYVGTQGDFIHSKLVFLSDKTGKTRIVAIGDWWSNISLSGIHDAFMAGLKKLNGDCTYRQGDIPRLIKGLGNHLFSSDMTAFTDRFPILIEAALVKLAYGEVIGSLWETVLTQRSFKGPNGPIKYAVGNPMGLLSSWAVSTFTHHAVKAFCAHKLNVRKYKYLVLGDDCMDTNAKVYDLYIETIQSLGVSVSRGKCTSSERGYAEFAKRLFTPEGEVTGIPVDLLHGIHKHPEQFIELVRILRNRGYKDTTLAPGVQVLLSTNTFKGVRETVVRVLSSSEELLGMPPLFIAKGLYQMQNPPVMGGFPEDSIRQHIEQARREVFWREVDKLSVNIQPNKPNPVAPTNFSRIHIPENHPALTIIGDQLMSYLGRGEGEYEVYDAWMSGKSYELVKIPTMETYRYRNRKHKASRARYDILKLAWAFALGNQEYRTDMPVKITDMDLFTRGFPQD